MSKKTFSSVLERAPAEAFITSAQKPQESAPQIQQNQKAPEAKHGASAPDEQESKGFSIELGDIVKTEAKTRRLQLLLKPSSYDALKKNAQKRGESVNSLINRLVEAYING